ncbi:response regulator transcription factor [Thioclava kandeliae]|uniref:Response regulator transcription factor n=1 Tax=Thioclava kandeliae TaxID=3070818 RepID=A0ABV1SEW6_9RHOB
MRVLMVEDTEDLAETVVTRFAKSGIACDHAPTLGDAQDFLRVQRYDAMVLDLNLPDGSGQSLLRSLRGRGDRLPILVLTALYSVDDRVNTLDLGADDYLVKPFDQRELEARLRALMRRETEQKSDAIRFGPLHYSSAQMSGTLNGQRLALTRREATLLGIFLRHPDQILGKERLYDGLFTLEDADVGLNAIELYVARLRRKLAGSGVAIATERGIGYRITLDG